VTGEGGGATSKEKVFRKQSLDQGFDIRCSKETTSGGEGVKAD